MPTRYTLDVDFKTSVSADVLDNSTKKVEVQKVSGQSLRWWNRRTARWRPSSQHGWPLRRSIRAALFAAPAQTQPIPAPMALSVIAGSNGSGPAVFPSADSLPHHLLSIPQECKKLLEEKFKTGKNRWFFSKLRF